MEPIIYSTALLCWSGLLVQAQTSGAHIDPVPTDHTDRGADNSYRFKYKNNDKGQHYHEAVASGDNTVAGRYGYREPGTGRITETSYTAGDRGFRARGPDIARKMDLSQVKIPYNPPVPINSPAYQPSYDTYFDPNEDASYDFNFQTRNYLRSESSGPRGDTAGQYSYVDDVGKRHDVQFEAGAGVGFHIQTPFPDSDPYGGLFYNGPNKPGTPLRGHTSIQRGKDGSYKFVSTGPDQKRTEVSDSSGRVRGSYTYLDDKGVQRSVDYIAGPGIGYKIINKGVNPVFPTVYPFVTPSYYPLGFSNKIPSKPSSFPSIFKPNTPADKFRPTELPGLKSDLFGKSKLGLNDQAFGKPVTSTKISPTVKPSECQNCFDLASPGPTTPQTLKPPFSETTPIFSPNKPTQPPIFSPDDKYKSPFFVKPLYQPALPKSQSFSTESPNSFLGPDSSIHDHITNEINLKPFSPPLNSAFPEDDPTNSNPKYVPLNWEEDLFGPKSTTATPIPSRGLNKFDPNNPNDGYFYDSPTQEFSSSGPGKPSYSPPKYGSGNHPEYNSHRQPYPSRPDDSNDRGSDKFYGFPPGVAVRAHVQSLDILPFGRRVPAPGEALERLPAERRNRQSQNNQNKTREKTDSHTT